MVTAVRCCPVPFVFTAKPRFPMIFVPLPFVVSLFLLTFLIRMIRRSDDHGRENRAFLVLVAVYACQSVLVGLRWGYGLTEIVPALAIMATLIPPLTYLAFRSLAGDGREPSLGRDWPHLLPSLAAILMFVSAREPIDLLIILDFFAYGVALLWFGRHGPDGLAASRLDGVLRSYRALQLTAFSLIGSALSDIAIGFDVTWGDGRHAALLVSGGTALVLMLLGIAASVTEPSLRSDETREGEAREGEAGGEAEAPASQADAEIASAVDALMQTRHLYRDLDLNLGKLARRLHLPARSVSNAINRIHGMSVSQYVNNYRITEAQRLLSSTDEPVTRIIFDAGFLTKSNFNREFLRVTGLTPTAWRRLHQRSDEAKAA
ncbi:AraC family transcriptional regulator [Rhizobium sp. CG5]|uniref:helix-turn-helix domain-containing protein n=1 Tax=Rhizobium sp. CG5 TaxID=2726076 RepID=UPI0020341815|nr:AraC family transcriptional regulator [Rhizobium sp. CG5]